LSAFLDAAKVLRKGALKIGKAHGFHRMKMTRSGCLVQEAARSGSGPFDRRRQSAAAKPRMQRLGSDFQLPKRLHFDTLKANLCRDVLPKERAVPNIAAHDSKAFVPGLILYRPLADAIYRSLCYEARPQRMPRVTP
jgi:hypothetical protein